MSEMALTADHLIVIGRGQLLSDMSVKDFYLGQLADFARVRTPDSDPQLREKLTSAPDRGGRARDVRSRTGGAAGDRAGAPRISDIAHGSDARLCELSPHQASLEEAYMRMTQGAVDYRSTADQKAGLQQPLPPGAQPPMPVPGQGQPGWYAPPPPQQGGQPLPRAPGRAGSGSGGTVRVPRPRPVRCRAGGPVNPYAAQLDASGPRTARRRPLAHSRPRARHRPDQARGRLIEHAPAPDAAGRTRGGRRRPGRRTPRIRRRSRWCAPTSGMRSPPSGRRSSRCVRRCGRWACSSCWSSASAC